MVCSKHTSLRIRPRENGDLASPVAHVEPQIRPKEREATIRTQIEQELQQRKEKDKQWEDASDVRYIYPVEHLLLLTRTTFVVPIPSFPRSFWLSSIQVLSSTSYCDILVFTPQR